MPNNMKICRASLVYLLGTLLVGLVCQSSTVRADDAANPSKPLINVAAPNAGKQVKPSQGNPTYTVDKAGIKVNLPGGPAKYPGIQVVPASGDSWDLAAFGHVEAKLTNTGDKPIKAALRVNGLVSGSPEQNGETVSLRPGESKVVKVIFGYQYGFKPGPAVNPSKISDILLFVGMSDSPQSFRVEDLQAAGPAGEKPPFNPDDVVTKPANGVILGQGVTFDPAKQVVADGATVAAGPDGSLAVNFTGGTAASLTIKPVMGVWDLTQANQLRVHFKNTGNAAVTPTVVVGSNKIPSKEPIAPGAESEITVSFIPVIPAVGIKDVKRKNTGIQKDTGTTFASSKAKEFSILADTTPGTKSLLVTSIIADAAPADIPDWLGKRPPVAGDWTPTFAEEFDGPTLDYHVWNIYTTNYWDRRTHFSKDNLILKDGKAILHYEKKTGFQNDDPNETKNIGKSDYACGFLNTFGKWTQRYGYFEARMKLPTAPGLWPAFWLMPDRGLKSGAKARAGTDKQANVDKGVGGMEFDIMEFLSGWGLYRFNIALHWDGYGQNHKSVGCEHIYTGTDKDGYITTGLLWTPGSAIIYNNGKEVFRWENERVSDVQEYLMFDMVSGGWDNTQLDDSKLPDDFTIDYVRVWQRKDLASPEDGPKPNNGVPDERKN